MRINVQANRTYTADVVKAALIVFLDARSDPVTFDEIRAAVDLLRGSPQGVIHQACLDVGYNTVMP